MKFSWYGITINGSRKPQNDDSWIVFSSNLQGTQKLPIIGYESLETKDLVFAISDGMGGGNAGHLASELILEKLSDLMPKVLQAAASGLYPDILSHLEQAISQIHNQINKKASESKDREGMAATLALTWFTPENMYLANVGDTRVYRIRSGKLEQLSKDHSFVWAQWKRKEIQEIEYRKHPRRSALYEIIGGNHTLVNPFLSVIPYQAGDRFLITSDGLIDGVWERQIQEFFGENSSLDQLSNKLAQCAISNAGQDDTTLMTIQINA